jgi:hypothetical protein
MRVFTSLLFGIILAAGPAVVSSRAQTPTGQAPTTETGKAKKHSKAKHAKPKKNKKEKPSS